MAIAVPLAIFFLLDLSTVTEFFTVAATPTLGQAFGYHPKTG